MIKHFSATWWWVKIIPLMIKNTVTMNDRALGEVLKDLKTKNLKKKKEKQNTATAHLTRNQQPGTLTIYFLICQEFKNSGVKREKSLCRCWGWQRFLLVSKA